MKGGPVAMGDWPPNRIEEGNLLIRAAAGDKEAQTDCYKQYFPEVRRVAMRVLKSYEEAEGIAHDVWIVFQDQLPQLAGMSDPHVAAWLCIVARNLSYNHRRKWIERIVSLSGLTPSNAETIVREAVQRIRRRRGYDDAAEDAVFEREIRAIVQSLLSDLEYEVFMSELDGAKPRETAADLGIPPARVHTLRHRIRARLRVFFGRNYESCR